MTTNQLGEDYAKEMQMFLAHSILGAICEGKSEIGVSFPNPLNEINNPQTHEQLLFAIMHAQDYITSLGYTVVIRDLNPKKVTMRDLGLSIIYNSIKWDTFVYPDIVFQITLVKQ